MGFDRVDNGYPVQQRTISSNPISINDLAKLLCENGYDTGQKRLFTRLRDEGYLIRREGPDYNTPTKVSLRLGLFEIKKAKIKTRAGAIIISKTTKVTKKGQIYFLNKFTLGIEGKR